MTSSGPAPVTLLPHACLPDSALRHWAEALAAVQHLEGDGLVAVLLPALRGGFEPLTLVAGLVPHTRRVGLVAGIDPAETSPFTAARRLAALDHASGGRMGWMLPAGVEPARAADYAAALRALWDSWGDGLHRIGRTVGRYVETSGIRAANNRGPFYRSAGPLDVARSPQGHPVHYAEHGAALPGTPVDARLGLVRPARALGGPCGAPEGEAP
ncbi:MAG: putative monooxygenase MoxC [Paracidovorax wautersii]|uniref:Putative monooxygenase MoxC n=1 Tax=Paracidovorax wautersii TaxID=1177982 RepID=A0A7V8JS06_9BURK|nr:MAG: putative monooxygenase MoxC [Paracidovorax wautersii]